LVIKFTDEFNNITHEYFWKNPSMLYHATKRENITDIKKDGLKIQNITRGLSNRRIGSAIFTSSYEEEDLSSYGDVLIKIDTVKMKNDGITPQITKEPNHIYSDVVNFLYKKLKCSEEDCDYSNAYSEGTSEYTYIVYGNIPAKYLTIIE